MGLVVDFSRATITHPTGEVERARFVYRNGSAAAWVGERDGRTGSRVLFATDSTFEKSRTARLPHRLILADGTEWAIKQVAGGCGCSKQMKHYSMAQLLDPDFSTAE